MATASAQVSFLSWPRANEAWEQALRWLLPQAEELWNRIQIAGEAAPGLQVYTVAGLCAGDGASTAAAALAHYAANALGQRVLLVEADLRGPRLLELGLAPRCPGLAGVLMRRVSLKHVVFHLPRPGFWVLPAGTELQSPAAHLSPERLHSFLEALQPHFDVVILDASPLTIAPESRHLIAAAHATVPVLRSGGALPEQAAYWLAKIGEYGGRIGAVCLNAVETPLPARLRRML